MSIQKEKIVLFVDDEESILDITRSYFEGRGYTVLTADNGRKAVELLQMNRIDCCFTDINMPEMDGLELAEYIHRLDNTLPVVVMTGYPSLENTIHTLKNGVVDYLIKPVNLQQMELCVDRVLRERNLFVQNIILSKEVEGKAKLEKLNTELLYKIEELNVLNRILTDFSTLRESNDIFKRLVDMSVEVVHADASHFYLINEDGDSPLTIASSRSRFNSEIIKTKLPRDGSGFPLFLDDPLIKDLVQEVVKDDDPLLIVENNNGERLQSDIRSFMLVPLKIRGKILGVLSAAVSQNHTRFDEKDLYYLSFMTKKAAFAVENLALYENIYSNLLATLYAFVKAIEARDPYTQQHSNRVTRLAIAIAEAMKCTEEEQEILNVAGKLHDIGKIGIRDEILLKPGRLTADEYLVIQQHPVIGSEIMDQLGLWDREKKIVRGHHERFDGKGYPDGLKSMQIPMLARILSVADVYDALASDRAYRRRMQEDQILEIIYGGAGSQFDPEVIKIFKRLYQSGKVAEVTKD